MQKIILLIQIFFSKIAIYIADIVVPEDLKIERILKINGANPRDLLPKSRVSLRNIDILLDYQNRIVRIFIKALKYKNNRNVRLFFAKYLADNLLEIASDIKLFNGKNPIIVPMPMSRDELRERGFNPCEELLNEVFTQTNNELEIRFDVLKKIKNTQRQARLGRDARLQNIKDSMSVQARSKHLIKNRVVIVFDDVYTTGATFKEAKRAILSAEAKECRGIFLAH